MENTEFKWNSVLRCLPYPYSRTLAVMPTWQGITFCYDADEAQRTYFTLHLRGQGANMSYDKEAKVAHICIVDAQDDDEDAALEACNYRSVELPTSVTYIASLRGAIVTLNEMRSVFFWK